jgi:hypothetical protein
MRALVCAVLDAPADEAEYRHLREGGKGFKEFLRSAPDAD